MFNDNREMLLGGLSGPNLLPIAARAVYEVRRNYQTFTSWLPVGFTEKRTQNSSLKVGADAVSIGSAIFQDEQVIFRIGKHILEYLKSDWRDLA